jgi:hypothetical protein
LATQLRQNERKDKKLKDLVVIFWLLLTAQEIELADMRSNYDAMRRRADEG